MEWGDMESRNGGVCNGGGTESIGEVRGWGTGSSSRGHVVRGGAHSAGGAVAGKSQKAAVEGRDAAVGGYIKLA